MEFNCNAINYLYKIKYNLNELHSLKREYPCYKRWIFSNILDENQGVEKLELLHRLIGEAMFDLKSVENCKDLQCLNWLKDNNYTQIFLDSIVKKIEFI